ncbi:MAG: methyltransferase domain-containing protein [Azoarcus sp.]|nr:methyltransferase domain-containing protein [Azoarcus sp.]
MLDYACGGGRHALWLARQGYRVEAADRNREALAALTDVDGISTRAVDLEAGEWPYAGQTFDAVVVSNYLFRAGFERMLNLVSAGGVLIYETFMVGNEQFGRPSSPEFLLMPGELLTRCAGWQIVAFEQGIVDRPRPAAIQRICAVRGPALATILP